MNTYTIGELLSAFNDDSYIGYCYKGDLKDRLIMCDTENENRLMWVKSDGEADYDFYFGLSDVSIEEARQFVFFHEVNDYPEIKKRIAECYLNALANELKNYDDNQDEN